jgi:hypothetical protein
VSSASITNNSFVDGLAGAPSSYINLLKTAEDFFTWICFGGTSQSIQKTVHFVNNTTCSTLSLLGTSWVHGLLPPILKPCDNPTRKRYDRLWMLIHVAVCKLAGVEGLFRTRHSHYGIELPSHPGVYCFDEKH